MAYSAQDRCVQDVVRLATARLDELELLRRATERLRRLVPFDFYCVNVTDPMSGVTTRASFEPTMSRPGPRLFFDRHYFEDFFPAHRRMAQQRRTAVSLSEETSGRPELASRYRDWMLPSGFAHELRMVCIAGGAIWGSVDLMRVPARPDFTPDDIRLAQRLATPLGEGLRAASIRPEEEIEGDAVAAVPPPLTGVLVLDGQGRVVRHTRAAQRLLTEIDPLRPEWAEGDDLPIALRVLASAVKHAPDSEERDEQTDSVCSVRVRARTGRWLTLEADLTEPGGDDPVETTVVIRPTPPQDMSRVKVAAYGLTAREKEVVDHVVQGASTTEIARTLYLSEYTVQEHLQNAFEKVGVRSRRALLRRLLFDDLRSTLHTRSEETADSAVKLGTGSADGAGAQRSTES